MAIAVAIGGASWGRAVSRGRVVTPGERELVATILRERNYDAVPFERILALLEKHHAIERVRDRAQAFTEKARAIIAELPESAYQRALLAVTELVTERDH